MKMLFLKCCKATFLKTIFLTAFTLVFIAAIKIYRADIYGRYTLDEEPFKGNSDRYEAVKDTLRESSVVQQEQREAFIYDDSDAIEEDLKFIENDSKFTVDDLKFIKKDSKFTEDDLKFIEDESKFIEDDSDFNDDDSGFIDDDSGFIDEGLGVDEQESGYDELNAQDEDLQEVSDVNDLSKLKNLGHGRTSSEKKRAVTSDLKQLTTNLLLFSTWEGKASKTNIRKSSLATWRQWSPHIIPLLFTDNKTLQEEARASKWEVRNITETSCKTSNVPTLRGMFKVAISDFGNKSHLFGFSNGDIVYDDGLNDTISALVKSELKTLQARPVLIVVRRINTMAKKNFVLSDVSVVKELAKKGEYKADGSTDFFITNHLFPWHDYPDLVIGRMGFGKWTVALAKSIGAAVYDLTRTVTAIHMTGPDGAGESSHNSDKSCNLMLIRRNGLLNFDTYLKCGTVLCSNKRADYKNGTIVFNDVDPKTLIKDCSLCENV